MCVTYINRVIVGSTEKVNMLLNINVVNESKVTVKVGCHVVNETLEPKVES
jgi:hypothetical protein